MNNIDTFSSFSEQSEMYQNIHDDENNSNSAQNFIIEDNDNEIETQYINEFYNEKINYKNNNIYSYGEKKRRNANDYLNFNDEDYKKQVIYKKINNILVRFKTLPQIYIKEINNYSLYYIKKFPNKKLLTIVSIVLYKIIKKYNIKTISLKDLKTKINFSYRNYFKNEHLFSELNEYINKNHNNKKIIKFNNNINNIIYSKKQSFSELVLTSVAKNIEIIKCKNKIYTNIIKLKNSKYFRDKYNNKSKNQKTDYNIIESIFAKYSDKQNKLKELYSNSITQELNNCLTQCKFFMYNNKQNKTDINKYDILSETNVSNHTINLQEENINFICDKNTFNNFFENKVDKDILSLSLIKYFIDISKEISMSYKRMNEIFNCNIYQIKKTILYIKEYINYINNN